MSEDKADAAAPFCPAPDRNPHPPKFALPPGATDCHAHVFEAARYGYQAFLHATGFTVSSSILVVLLAIRLL
jgi:hypothetical protein